MEYYVISSYSQFGRMELIVLNKNIAPLIIIIIIANTYKAPLTTQKKVSRRCPKNILFRLK